MNNLAIRVSNISKEYRLGVIRRSSRKVHRQKNSSLPSSGSQQRFWALDDVSFDVAKGEVMGVIGGNGAGKSTLLKILSGITMPTKGRAVIVGRSASLL